MEITVALVGNPNVGKTSLFNSLTGSKQYVANWPGVTVSRKEGKIRWKGFTIKIVDLPGIYSLGAVSLDERITRKYLVEENPDVVVVIVDALNMEQGLYLLMEVLEMRENVVLVVNAIDEARKAGMRIDKRELEKHFGVHVVFTSAVTKEGIADLLDTIIHVARSKYHSFVRFEYPEWIEKKIKDIENAINGKIKGFKPRWLAVKFLEGDPEIVELLKRIGLVPPQEDYSTIRSEIAKARYEYIETVLREAVSTSISRMTLSDALDHVLTHKFLGIPIFLSFMYLTFKFTFDLVSPLSDIIDSAFSKLGDLLSRSMGEGWMTSLVVDGVIGGVGSVLVFVPNIFALFLALGFLEESGYLPRAAFVVDRLMQKFKLSGRAFISLILGFGCNVPAIMSTRGISDPKERLVTILVSPFISCSARLPVYIIIIGSIFEGSEAAILFAIYLSSIFLTVVSSVFWNRVLFKGEPVPLVMELPRYRFPTFKNLVLYAWNRGKHFLEKAGTIILISSIVIWFLGSFPGENVEESFAAMLGKFLEPIFRPIGFTWQMVTALIFGMAAKEVVVSTFAMLYNFSEESIETAKMIIKGVFQPHIGLAFVFFVMAYVPCFATIAAVASESGNWKWAILAILYSLAVAYILALSISLVGRFLI